MNKQQKKAAIHAHFKKRLKVKSKSELIQIIVEQASNLMVRGELLERLQKELIIIDELIKENGLKEELGKRVKEAFDLEAEEKQKAEEASAIADLAKIEDKE